jgi:hypothetical protein
VRNAIVNVTKYSNIFDTSGTKVLNSATTDDIWIPSNKEIFGGTDYETLGYFYNEVFASADNRKKSKNGGSNPGYWWFRTASTDNLFRLTRSDGANGSGNAGYLYPIAIGFCL